LPTPAAPSIGQFKLAFEKAFEDGHKAIVVHASPRAVGYGEARPDGGRDVPGRAISVVDSKSASLGIVLSPCAQSRCLVGSLLLGRSKRSLRNSARSVDLYVGLDTLEYLRKGRSHRIREGRDRRPALDSSPSSP